MLEFSWSHLLIFALAAIVLVPSKDLPALLRTVGKYVGQARRMASDFRSQVDDALRESELAELQKSVQADLKGIEESASMADTERALRDAVAAPAPAAAKSPTLPGAANGSIIPSVATALPVDEATTAALRGPADAQLDDPVPAHAAAPMPAEPAKISALADAIDKPAPALNGARRTDGIEVVRAGRGSVATRAAAAWKKTAGSQAGSEG